MSALHFSKQEMAFFEEGDTLADEAVSEDFSDLDEEKDCRSGSWVGRALAVLTLVSSE